MLKAIIAGIEALFPGAEAVIQQYLSTLTEAQIVAAIRTALSDWSSGASFVQILTDILARLNPQPLPPG